MEDEIKSEGFLHAWARRTWWMFIFIGGVAVGLQSGVYMMQRDAIANNAGQYNSKTSGFEWIKDDARTAQAANALAEQMNREEAAYAKKGNEKIEATCAKQKKQVSIDSNGIILCK